MKRYLVCLLLPLILTAPLSAQNTPPTAPSGLKVGAPPPPPPYTVSGKGGWAIITYRHENNVERKVLNLSEFDYFEVTNRPTGGGRQITGFVRAQAGQHKEATSGIHIVSVASEAEGNAILQALYEVAVGE